MLEVQESSKSKLLTEFFIWSTKWISGFIISFFTSTVGMYFLDYGTFSFVFVLVACHSFYWKLFHNARLVTTLIVNAIIVFLVLALRLYIAIGPNI